MLQVVGGFWDGDGKWVVGLGAAAAAAGANARWMRLHKRIAGNDVVRMLVAVVLTGGALLQMSRRDKRVCVCGWCVSQCRRGNTNRLTNGTVEAALYKSA